MYTRTAKIFLTTLIIFFGGCKMTPDQSARKQMVDLQIKDRGVLDKKVLQAMTDVPRHIFAPGHDINVAYADTPLPIGNGQTISQPYIVAFMTESAELKGNEKVLEIGTGSGYQAAVLSKIVKEVYTIEIIEALGKNAEKVLKENGYNNVHVKIGDGYSGWPEHAPFDVIIITAAPDDIPQNLLKQLKIGGRMIVPIGSFIQELVRITKTEKGFAKEDLIPVRFVPMTGNKQ
jgi:protein-L-isoaspartate(D-aspartate) O-methyltransferase